MTGIAPLEDLASYVPALILRRMALAGGATMVPSTERFPAAVLFADLSGFTALTEQFTQRNPAGAEELTQILDLYFGHLVGVVMSHGGDVVKFAGDGLLALWYGDEDLPMLTQRAVQCGLAVQMMMAPDVWGGFDTSRPPPSLKVRVGVGAGDVTTMHVGGIFGRWELLVTGEALSQASAAETEARPGDVVITAAAWPLAAPACTGDILPSGAVRLTGLIDYLPMRSLSLPTLDPQLGEALRAYIPKAIVARMDAGQTAWLAEQRRVTVLFINLPDLHADTPLRQAQTMMRTLQSMLYRFEGSVTRLGTDSKGPTLVAALGLPPLAHEDDPERGVRAALAIYGALAEQGLRCAIGVTTGHALCAAVGGQTRREYTMMGTIVNRSARLMQAAAALTPADAPMILCDQTTYRAAQARLRFEALPPLALKGVAELVPVFRPLVEITAASGADHTHPAILIGREREQSIITELVNRLVNQRQGGALIVEGDAGIGKSGLLEDLRQRANAAGMGVFSGVASPLDGSPYYAWRQIFTPLLAPIAAPGDIANLRDLVALAGERLGPQLDLGADIERMAPLLRAVLPIELPETTITAQMSGQVRADNTRDLLVRLLDRSTIRRPLVLIFEDAQWLDASSWALISAVAERVEPLLLGLAARTMADIPPEFQRLAYLPRTRRIQLRGLPAEDIRDLLAQRLQVASVPSEVWQLIAARSQGNPFFAEELVYALRDSGLLMISDSICKITAEPGETLQALNSVRLPDTVQGLVTSRIDRLSPEQQLTLKVASVIGQSFKLATLAAIHPVESDPEILVDQLFSLQQMGLVLIESFEPELVYAFKHAVAAEVAYNLMSFSQRRHLHRVLAERYDDADTPAKLPYAQLAYHWCQAGEPGRAMGYLALAGEQALRAGAYREAARQLNEALDIADAEPAASQPDSLTRARWEHQLAEAYHGMGRLIESRELLARAAARIGYSFPGQDKELLAGLAEELLRQAGHRLFPRRAHQRRDTGRYSEAARIYGLLSQLAYYDSQLMASIYAALRGLNLAERSGLSPVLARAYATTHLAVGMLPGLARLYRRRAQAAANFLGHLPTHLWVVEAQGLYYLGHAIWRHAEGALNLALSIADRLGDQRSRDECRALLVLVAKHQGQLQLALERSATLHDDGLSAGDIQVCTWSLLGQAENLLLLGDDAPAAVLLNEAELLLTENFNSARAEEIWTYALLARAALRRGEYSLARSLAGAAARLIGAMPPAAIYALGGYTSIAEVFLSLWELGADESQTLRDAAGRACRSLGRFALIFPLARPITLIYLGQEAWLRGRRRLAQRRWQRALSIARRMEMPYEQGYAHLQIGRHLTGVERHTHLKAAAAIFARLGAAYDLGIVEGLL